VDAQAGHEKTITFLLPALAGCNLIYGMGMLELGMTLSLAQLVIDDEIAAMVKRVVRGISVSDETLAVDLITEVGPGNTFMGRKHTRAHQKAEQSRTKLFDRRMRGKWEKRGAKDLAQAGADRARELLRTHQPLPLPSEVAAELRRIVRTAEDREGVANRE
jgi:trimethylamine--corrinoid protein Co-methyltransferase